MVDFRAGTQGARLSQEAENRDSGSRARRAEICDTN